jgi:hypothetical protein
VEAVYFEQLADETMVDIDAEADAMSDRECYEINEKWRKRDGFPPLTFEEFMGYLNK